MNSRVILPVPKYLLRYCMAFIAISCSALLPADNHDTPAQLFSAVEAIESHEAKIELLNSAAEQQQNWPIADQGHYYFLLGSSYDQSNDIETARQSYSHTIELLSGQSPVSVELIKAMTERSYMIYLQTNSKQKYCPDRYEALRLARILDDKEILVGTLIKTAFCYQEDPALFGKGLSVLEEALKIQENNPLTDDYRGMIYNATALLYQHNQLHSQAYDYSLQAYQHWEKLDDRQDMFNMQHTLVGQSLSRSEWDDAAKHVEVLFDLAERSPEFKDFYFFAYYNDALLSFRKNDFTRAIELLNKALSLADTTKEAYFVNDLQIMLAISSFRTGGTETAGQFARQYLAARAPSAGKSLYTFAASSINDYVAGDHQSSLLAMWEIQDLQTRKFQQFVHHATLARSALYDQNIDKYQQQLLLQELEIHRLQLQSEQANSRLAYLITIVVLALMIGLAVISIRLYRSGQLFKHHARTDPLTGIANRRYALEQCEVIINKAQISEQPVSILMLDIDYFKKINDTYGHDVGDQAIKFVVKVCDAHLDSTGVLGRLGGEEFLLVLPGYTADQAFDIADQIRHQVETHIMGADAQAFSMTVSLGVVQLTSRQESMDDLLKAADQALYSAKNTGRNRVTGA